MIPSVVIDRSLGGLHPHVGATVVVVAEMNLPRLTTHLTVLDIGMDGSAGGIHTDGHDFGAVGTGHLDLRVPGLGIVGLTHVASPPRLPRVRLARTLPGQ